MNDRLFGLLTAELKESREVCFSSVDGSGRARSIGRDSGLAGVHLCLGGDGRHPVPRHQFREARARPALGHLVDDAGQIGVRVETVVFGGFEKYAPRAGRLHRCPGTDNFFS